MSEALTVHTNRTNTFVIDLNEDVSADILTSEIRSEPNLNGLYIAEFVVTFETDGTDGKVVLTLDELIAGNIQAESAYMDIRREIGGGQPGTGVPVPVFDEPLLVNFIGVVTE